MNFLINPFQYLLSFLFITCKCHLNHLTCIYKIHYGLINSSPCIILTFVVQRVYALSCYSAQLCSLTGLYLLASVWKLNWRHLPVMCPASNIANVKSNPFVWFKILLFSKQRFRFIQEFRWRDYASWTPQFVFPASGLSCGQSGTGRI